MPVENNRIAYLILAHADPEHLRRLTLRLLEDPVADVFIHLDRKTGRSAFDILLRYSERVFWLEDRITLWWAGSTIVQATLALLSAAVESGRGHTRYVLLSGSDYPILHASKIHAALDNGPHRQIISAFRPLRGSTHYRHATGFWFENRILTSTLLDKILRKALEVSLSRFRRRIPIPLFVGSQWWSITIDCAHYVLKYVHQHTEELNFIQYSFAPDEYFFHSIIYNSRFKTECPAELVWTESLSPYSTADLHVVHLSPINETRYQELRTSSKLFVRKVSTLASQKLLDLLDRDSAIR